MNNKNLKLTLSSLLFILSLLLLFIPFLTEDLFKDFIGWTVSIGFILAGASIGLFLRFNSDKPHLVKKLGDEIKFKYQLDEIYVSNDLSGVVGFSKEKKVMYLMSRANLPTGIEILNDRYMFDAFQFENITNINIIENDNVIVNSTNKNSIGQSVKGGFGNEGIQNSKVVYKIRIQAITNDIVKPSSDVFLYNSNIGIKRSSDEYKELYKKVNDFLIKINGMINK